LQKGLPFCGFKGQSPLSGEAVSVLHLKPIGLKMFASMAAPAFTAPLASSAEQLIEQRFVAA
jgi:hypothetical protein